MIFIEHARQKFFPWQKREKFYRNNVIVLEIFLFVAIFHDANDQERQFRD